MMAKTDQPDFPIRVKYNDAEFKYSWRYKYNDADNLYWEEFYFDSICEALEYGLKYVRLQLLCKQRQCEEGLTDVNSRLEKLG